MSGFSKLKKRSGELDGNLPVRAARYCGPVFEGSAAGFQISVEQPMTVFRNRRGKIGCDMTPPTLRLVTEQVDEALERGIKEGLIARGGHWHRQFKGDAMPIWGEPLDGMDRPHEFRPRAGLWILVGGAFNRRSRVSVVDHLASDPDHFVPLVVTPSGFSRQQSSPGTLQFGLVRNFAPTRWTWQGQTHPVFEVRKERHVPALEALWKVAFGDAKPSGLEFLRGHLIGEVWDQPYVQFQPWVLASTPPGWSMLVDGVHGTPAYDGMRAVIATDWFFALAMVYRIYGPSSAKIPFRAPMLRALPVPRGTLALGMKESAL